MRTALALTLLLQALAALAPAASAQSPALAPTPLIRDDRGLQHALERARREFLRAQPFGRLDVTVLVEREPGIWLRGSVGGGVLSYPASCVKLPYLVAAVAWCRAHGRGPDCLDDAVRPMVVESDNVATGTVVDAITGTTNQPQGAAGLEEWIESRRYVERLLDDVGLLAGQRLFTKTYPTNSGEEPTGFEALARARLGRNAMAPDPAARLMLAVQEGTIEPQARDYMRSLLRRPPFSGHSSLGGGLPPGSLHENKIGTAYDTLQDIMYAQLPNGVRVIIAAFSNGYSGEEQQPWDAARLGRLAELVVAHARLDRGLPRPRYLSATSRSASREGRWQLVRERSALGPRGYLRSDGDTAARLSWRVRVETPGRYAIAAWYPAGGGHAAATHFVIRHAHGETTVPLDQRTWGARWLPLGDYELDGDGGSVTLLAPGGGQIAADTLRVTRWAPPAPVEDAGRAPRTPR